MISRVLIRQSSCRRVQITRIRGRKKRPSKWHNPKKLFVCRNWLKLSMILKNSQSIKQMLTSSRMVNWVVICEMIKWVGGVHLCRVGGCIGESCGLMKLVRPVQISVSIPIWCHIEVGGRQFVPFVFHICLIRFDLIWCGAIWSEVIAWLFGRVIGGFIDWLINWLFSEWAG